MSWWGFMLSSSFWCSSHPHVCCCHLLLSRQSLQPLQAEYARQEPGESNQEDIEMYLGEIDEVILKTWSIHCCSVKLEIKEEDWRESLAGQGRSRVWRGVCEGCEGGVECLIHDASSSNILGAVWSTRFQMDISSEQYEWSDCWRLQDWARQCSGRWYHHQ